MATQELALVKQENIQAIVSSAPKAYDSNRMSHDRCLEFGNALLAKIEAAGGMNEQLDQEVADYLNRVATTLKKINDNRAPVTRLFDELKKVFTALENDIDKGKAGTLPYRLQALRNAYAKQKYEEAERRRKEEEARQRALVARNKYIQDVREDYRRLLNEAISNSCRTLARLDNEVTLDNFDKTYKFIDEFPTELPVQWLQEQRHNIGLPSDARLDINELREIETEIKKDLYKEFSDHYAFEVSSTKEYILERMPSRKSNLEKMAKANAEDAARMKAEMEERQRKEQERIEEEKRKKAEKERQMAEMEGLFAAQEALMTEACAPAAPKVKVSKKIQILNTVGILPVIQLWFANEGIDMTIEQLEKMFKKQITYCEKLANNDDVMIEDINVIYVDDVKAK